MYHKVTLYFTKKILTLFNLVVSFAAQKPKFSPEKFIV